MAKVDCKKIIISQGDTDSIVITLRDENREIIDLTSVSEAIFSAKTSINGSEAFRLTLSSGEIVKDNLAGKLTLNFTVSKTDSVSPGIYVPYLKIIESINQKQYHVDEMLLDSNVNWEELEIMEAAITDTF